MLPPEIYAVLLVGACVLTAVAVASGSTRVARDATVGACTMVAVMALAAGRAAGIPVAVVCAAVVERIARYATTTASSRIGHIGVALTVAVAAAAGGQDLAAAIQLGPAPPVSLSHGSLMAMALSSVGVLVARAVTGRG